MPKKTRPRAKRGIGVLGASIASDAEARFPGFAAKDSPVVSCVIVERVEYKYSVLLQIGADGSVSLHGSTGGALIGIELIDDVATQARALIAQAAYYAARAKRTIQPWQLKPGIVIFYFLTRRGLRYYVSSEQDLEPGKSLFSLFYAGAVSLRPEIQRNWHELPRSRPRRKSA